MCNADRFCNSYFTVTFTKCKRSVCVTRWMAHNAVEISRHVSTDLERDRPIFYWAWYHAKHSIPLTPDCTLTYSSVLLWVDIMCQVVEPIAKTSTKFVCVYRCTCEACRKRLPFDVIGSYTVRCTLYPLRCTIHTVESIFFSIKST